MRITRCTFRLDETKAPRWGQYWVYVVGSRSGNNQFDRNLFEKQRNRGSMLFIRGDDATLSASQHDRVMFNHFRDVFYANDNNGHETLRTGSNDLGAAGKSTFTLIASNLFERCSGEQEIISLKSSENAVRHNTFIDCRGSICLRLGNRNEIIGNFFQGLTGQGHEAPLALIPGTMNTESTSQIGKAYRDLTTAPATRVTMSQNTWIDCSPLVFGNSKPDRERIHVPNNCLFTSNVVTGAKSPLIQLGAVSDLVAKENVGYKPKTVPAAEAWVKWFRWEQTLPTIKPPTPLTSAEVGPNAL